MRRVSCNNLSMEELIVVERKCCDEILVVVRLEIGGTIVDVLANGIIPMMQDLWTRLSMTSKREFAPKGGGQAAWVPLHIQVLTTQKA